MVYFYQKADRQRNTVMQEKTTIKVRKTTINMLKAIAQRRGRCESLEQVVLELIDSYTKTQNA